MFEKRKIEIQKKQIESLSSQVEDLKKENALLLSRIDNEKSALAIQRNELSNREILLVKRENELTELLNQIHMIKKNYERDASVIESVRTEIEKQMKKTLDKIKA